SFATYRGHRPERKAREALPWKRLETRRDICRPAVLSWKSQLRLAYCFHTFINNICVQFCCRSLIHWEAMRNTWRRKRKRQNQRRAARSAQRLKAVPTKPPRIQPV